MMQAETGGTEETLESFSRSLDELTGISEPLIDILSGVAAENVPLASAIVKTVNERLEKAPSGVILPILHLIDSIMKNVGGDYINLFSATLKDSFANSFAKADKSTRHLLGHLRQTWSKCMSSQDLNFIDKQVHALEPSWPMITNSVVTSKYHSLKILVNPDFLPPTKNDNLEDDNEEILREQLIQQMRKRKLERDQRFKDEESSHQKEQIVENCSHSEETSEIQADSTTVEKSAVASTEKNHLLNQCRNPLTLVSTEDTNMSTKPTNSELFQLLSDLIVKGNKKLHCNEEERQPSVNGSKMCEEPRREHREYGKRGKLSKHSDVRISRRRHKKDDKYCYEYSSRREERYARSRKYGECNSHVSKETKSSGHSSLLSEKVLSSSGFQRCDSPLSSMSSGCGGSSHISSDCIGVKNDQKKVSIDTNSPPTKRKFLQTIIEYGHQINVSPSRSISTEQELLPQRDPPHESSKHQLQHLSTSNVEHCTSVPVRHCYSPHQRTLLYEDGQGTSHPGHFEPHYNTKEHSFIFNSNVRHVPVKVNPINEIDYKHGCGAPVIRVFGGFNRNNKNVPCPAQPPFNHVSLPSFSVPNQNEQVLGSDHNISKMTRFHTFLPPNNFKDHSPERLEIGSWGSKMATQDLTVECNMRNFPLFGKKFMSEECIEGSLNSINVDTLTAQVQFHSENTQYSRDIISGQWHKHANNSVPPAYQLPLPFLKKGGKRRHQLPQRLKRQAMRSALNAQCQLQTLYDPSEYGIINGSSSNITQPREASESSAVFRPCVNVHALFQSLCEVGLLIPSSTQNVTLREDSVKAEIHAVDFKDSSSFRRRQPGIIEELHYGLQCSSCGERFITEQASEYREHLDWHFKQNHSSKDSKRFENRKWYCTRKHWLESVPIHSGKSKAIEPKKEESSVPSNYFARGAVCEVCRDKFEEFFNEDQDEWHLKDCLSSEGIPYHPSCFKDSKMSTTTPDSIFDPEGQNSSILYDRQPNFSRTEVCDETAKGCEAVNCDVVPCIMPFIYENECNKGNCDGENSAQEETQKMQPSKTEVSLPSPTSTAFEVAQSNTCTQGVGKNEPIDDNKAALSESFLDISLSEVKDEVSNFEKEEELACLSPKVNCGAVEQSDSNQILAVEVEGLETSGVHVDMSLVDCMPSSMSDVNCEELKISALKPKLVGRKLTILPPVVKGSETSNLCCLS